MLRSMLVHVHGVSASTHTVTLNDCEWDTCGTCPIAAIWLPCTANFSFVFSLVSPAGFVGSEQD